MSVVDITGFHTCKPDGGAAYLLEHAPFLSQSTERQWLTQGYYFWTDSTYFAHIWGRDGYENEYAILECAIQLDATLLLDLVGSVDSQLFFKKLLQRFQKHLRKVSGDAADRLTVNAVISFYRKESERQPKVFPYLAIKAQDDFVENDSIRFTHGRDEKMPLGITRQQLCIFEQADDVILNKRVVHPNELEEQSDRILENRINRRQENETDS